MYKRLIILSLIIILAMTGLAGLGYHSIIIRAQGMEAKRTAEFAAVADSVRRDIMKKLDNFMEQEQNRPYTDYQYFSFAQNPFQANQTQTAFQRSPLAGKLENEFAIGNFQIDTLGNITTANDSILEIEGSNEFNKNIDIQNSELKKSIKNNLLPALRGNIGKALRLPEAGEQKKEERLIYNENTSAINRQTDEQQYRQDTQPKGIKSSLNQRTSNYRVESLEKQRSMPAQILNQSRDVVSDNVVMRQQQQMQKEEFGEQKKDTLKSKSLYMNSSLQKAGSKSMAPSSNQIESEIEDRSVPSEEKQQKKEDLVDSYRDKALETARKPGFTGEVQEINIKPVGSDMVQIRIEPFVPVVVPGQDEQNSVFKGQVFLLRHVQIENEHLLQGFRLDEKKLLDEIQESALKLIRQGMKFEISQIESAESAYTAILDFGFGDVVLNLFEAEPDWIVKEMRAGKNWYFGIISIVFAAVALALASLWKNAHEQLILAQKKDDFLSAVSHELRTPLTSIRMYSEMLEKNWVKSQDKLTEYYRNMRQESERLTRLIENVLDFSRIQRGKKKFNFSIGSINECIEKVTEMMRPYAFQHGFEIQTDLADIGQTAFDGDAVTQIVVNLIDNAVKYARAAQDKTITIRSAKSNGFITIEVEDYGPGIPYRYRKKVFEQFYRCEAEATRETTGTGLGLALVKRFAEAHDGFVEIISAKPTGSIFRVTLAIRN